MGPMQCTRWDEGWAVELTARRKTVLRLWHQGYTIQELADMAGVPYGTAYNDLIAMGVSAEECQARSRTARGLQAMVEGPPFVQSKENRKKFLRLYHAVRQQLLRAIARDGYRGIA